MSKRHTINSVTEYFKEQGCELLEASYINNKTKMTYRCSCGNISQIKYAHFRDGHRCKKCGAEKKANKDRHSFEYVYDYFKEQNCELLEKKYQNNRIPMKYKCNCGNISMVNFSSFKSGQRCRKCSGCEKLTFEYVYNYFKEQNCELLEKAYKDNRTPMKYKCNCGNISVASFHNFRRGNRCRTCGILRISGKNNYNYNPDLTDEDREKNKTRHKDYIYKQWRQTVFKGDNYTCRKCFKKGVRLNAHHIESWASNVSLRLVVSNGVTLCEQCHKSFHKIYGKISNDKTQLDKYLDTKSPKVY